MVSPTKRITVEDFDKWIFLSENIDKSFEFIGREIFEVVSNNYSSEIAGEMLFQIKLYLRQNQLNGHVTGMCQLNQGLYPPTSGHHLLY